MKSKTASLLILMLTLVGFVLLPVLLVFFVDPFQIYHRSFFKQAGYSGDQGYQHVGWINTVLADPKEAYTSIVVGSSVMANYDQSLFNSVLPRWGKVMNLSVNGGIPKMQAAIATHALDKAPDIKNILWDVHCFYVFDNLDSNMDFPYYLYNGSLFDDGEYFFNATNFYSSISFLVGKFGSFSYGIQDNGPWYDSNLAAGRFDVFKSLEARKKMLADILSAPVISMPSQDVVAGFQYPSVEKYMLNVIMPLCNTSKQIDITFSPATRYYYATQGDINFVQKQIHLRRYLMEKTLSCSNMRVFAFDNVGWIVTDLTNYMDNFHYKKKVNEYVLQSIAKNEHHLTPDTIDAYEKNFVAAINAYRQQYIEELKTMEQAEVSR